MRCPAESSRVLAIPAIGCVASVELLITCLTAAVINTPTRPPALLLPSSLDDVLTALQVSVLVVLIAVTDQTQAATALDLAADVFDVGDFVVLGLFAAEAVHFLLSTATFAD